MQHPSRSSCGAGPVRPRLLVVLVLAALAGCSTAPLDRAGVDRARAPVQADVAARLDRLGLPLVGVEHDAVCSGGQDDLIVRDDVALQCFVREVRVGAVSSPDLSEARAEADAALQRLCEAGGTDLADDRSAGRGTLRTQFRCGELVVDVLLCPPDSPALRGSSLFAASPAPGQTSPSRPVGVEDAERSGVPYVLLVMGHEEFFRQPR